MSAGTNGASLTEIDRYMSCLKRFRNLLQSISSCYNSTLKSYASARALIAADIPKHH